MPEIVPPPSDRSFGLLFAVVFGVLAAWLAWAGTTGAASALTALAVLTLLVALLRASLLNPLNRAWMKLGALLHRLVSPVILGAIYFLVITPYAIVMRLAGRDALRRRLDPITPSYWIKREPPGPAPDSLPHQF